MKCLTSREISRWLTRHGHDDELDIMPAISFYAPIQLRATEYLADCLLREVFVGGDVLLVINDTDFEHPRHLKVVNGLRLMAGEKRPLSASAGFLFTQDEWEHAVMLFSLCASFYWKCYLWGARDQLTLFNWEGEIFDVWPGSQAGRKAVLRLLESFRLKRIIRRAKTRGK